MNQKKNEKCNNIKIIAESCNCIGCENCRYCCGSKAISMQRIDGFLYPSVDDSICCNCGMCKKVCPVIAQKETSEIKTAYMAVSIDKRIIRRSSSGGVFASVARHYLNKYNNCIIVGASYKDDMVQHIIIYEDKDIPKIQGSKYVWSSINNVRNQICDKLIQGYWVIFGGTPCQCQAIKAYIQAHNCSEEKLILIDILCHGVSDIEFLKKEINSYVNYKDVTDIGFRWKNNIWKNKSKYILQVKTKRKIIKMWLENSPYFNSYMQGVILRDNCFRCEFVGLNRVGDITIGDCNINDIKGFRVGESVSDVLINTEKGEDVWEEVRESFEYAQLDLDEEKKYNMPLSKPADIPDLRKCCIEDFNKEYDYKEMVRKYSMPINLKGWIKSKIKELFPDKITKIIIR